MYFARARVGTRTRKRYAERSAATLQAPSGVVTYFEHGAHGLVTKITPMGGTAISFGYDALLRRVRMDEGSVHTYFRHDGIDLLEIADTSGNLTKLTHGYRTIPGIGSVVEIEKNGTRYYLHQDHRGTTYKITDSAGDVVWSALCDAWGNIISETGSNPSVFWYQGEAWWKLTVNDRLYYVSPTRIYDVQDGRFVERDVQAALAGRYIYSQNSVLRRVDANGRKDEEADSGAHARVQAAVNGVVRRLMGAWLYLNAYPKNPLPSSTEVILIWDRSDLVDLMFHTPGLSPADRRLLESAHDTISGTLDESNRRRGAVRPPPPPPPEPTPEPAPTPAPKDSKDGLLAYFKQLAKDDKGAFPDVLNECPSPLTDSKCACTCCGANERLYILLSKYAGPLGGSVAGASSAARPICDQKANNNEFTNGTDIIDWYGKEIQKRTVLGAARVEKVAEIMRKIANAGQEEPKK